MEPKRLGPYRIVGTLGHGGMGSVYQAVNEETGQPAAVKILSAAMSTKGDFRHRFQAEIETLKKLRHPNIVRLYGFGEHGGLLFYAMELVDGSSLDEQLQQGRLFTWREVAKIGVETCRALRHAHDRGVIHRDLKPANLLVAKEGQVKLSDFGIARLFGNTGVTAAGNVVGTVEFMAPEQADARPVGPRTDLYSLGAVFFALLAGRPPFRAATPLKMLEKQRSARPEPVRRYAPNVPVEFECIISQLLEKDPNKRISNASLLSRQLEAMLHALAHLPDTPEAEMGRTVEGGFDLSSPTATGHGTDRDALATKKSSEEIEGQSSTADGPSPQAVEMPETKVTSALQAYVRPDSPAPAPGRDPERRSDTVELDESEEDEKPPDRFIAVDEEELDRTESGERLERALISPQTWVLAVGLIAVGLGAWYLLEPLSDDALYQRIVAVTADGKISSLLEAEDDIQEFLMRFSNDPRCQQLREYEKEIELNRLERRLGRKEQAGIETLLPIEREYLKAIECGRYDPQRGIEQLRAIIDLYEDKLDDSGPTGQCLELVQRGVVRLSRRLQAWGDDDLAVLNHRLDRADELSRSGSAERQEEANRIRRGVIKLHADEAWLKEVVQRAREALAREEQSP